MASAVDWFGGEVSAEQAERLAALYDLDAPHGPSAPIDWFRAIARRTHGEVLVPHRARPLVAIGAAFPGLSRLVLRIVR